jgi:putative tributyrin esterase
MALIHCDFFSRALGLATSMFVILPEPRPDRPRPAQGWPTLYLLHGLMGDHTSWTRETAIERYVQGLNLVMVMPAGGRSFYTDMARGLKYWTFVSQELPALARGMFPLSAAREDNFVAGLSMGGYGAFKMALRCPEKFAAAASLSGSLDMAAHPHEGGDWIVELENVFGPLAGLAGSDNDLLALAARLAASPAPRPALYQWCGTEDFLYPDNVAFRDLARRLKLDLLYEEAPGDHNWLYWDRQIRRVLEWLPLKRTEA